MWLTIPKTFYEIIHDRQSGEKCCWWFGHEKIESSGESGRLQTRKYCSILGTFDTGRERDCGVAEEFLEEKKLSRDYWGRFYSGWELKENESKMYAYGKGYWNGEWMIRVCFYLQQKTCFCTQKVKPFSFPTLTLLDGMYLRGLSKRNELSVCQMKKECFLFFSPSDVAKLIGGMFFHMHCNSAS